MVIREARVADIAAYMEVRLAVRENVLHNRQLVTDADNVDYLTRRGKGWVAEVEGRIVGFAIADLLENSIWALFVHPAFQGQGIGRALHQTMLDWYFSQRREKVWLSTAPGTRAELFYRKAGWQNQGLKENGELRLEMEPEQWLGRATK